jgi:hypothetical protein
MSRLSSHFTANLNDCCAFFGLLQPLRGLRLVDLLPFYPLDHLNLQLKFELPAEMTGEKAAG